MSKELVKEVAAKYVRDMMTRTGTPIGASLEVSTDSLGNPVYGVGVTTGNLYPDESTVELMSEMLSSIIVDILPHLVVETDVIVSTSTGQGTGTGSVGF